MTLIEIVRYAYEHPCSTLFVYMSLDELEGSDWRMFNERYSNFGPPGFLSEFCVNAPKKRQKIMIIRDDSVVGARFEEFNTIRPDDYLNFTGEK